MKSPFSTLLSISMELWLRPSPDRFTQMSLQESITWKTQLKYLDRVGHSHRARSPYTKRWELGPMCVPEGPP